MTSSIWIRDSIKSLTRIRDSYEDRSKMYRMDRNERTWPISEMILNEIKQRTTSDIFTNYTEIDGTYHMIADHLGVKYDQIYLHSGSDLVIKSIFETYVESGDKVLLQNPSYAMYGVYAKMYAAEVYEQDFEEDLSFDLNSYTEKITKIRPKLAVLENPGGYIGNSYSFDEVKSFIDTAHKCETLAVIDEAYIDFIPGSSAVDLIETYDNVIIVRTFSKAWGLAGLRAGYAVSNELLISELFKVRPMHELTAFTALAVEVMLSHAEDIDTYIEDVKEVRNYFCDELDKLGFPYAKSDTHFVTVCIGDKLDTEDFRNKAHERKFYVRRPFGQQMLKNWVRIGLLPKREMTEFVDFLKECLGK